ncbi:MAG: hypothetical protein ACXWD7_06265 [Solirubrobacterales bacterium]
MRRRIAAATATAAIAVGGGVSAAAAPGSPVRGKANNRIAGSERTNGAEDMAVMSRRERAQHRERLASALAEQLPGADAERVGDALASTEHLLAGAYAGGLRLDPGAELARLIGVGEDEVDAAFEAMSRRALQRRRA